ncbi:MAG TPA: undecaprenyldiphospho-muramoylpentapeptide beta-N-acetylglucosaminyltransferase [Verrucomicrobiae bacterium]|nr:undecaprenyldiphospho-muramoylpentapeptide beta-N-acetylglucosaminyltransferase [Verrucomicrobiae bacterium]
MKVPDTKTPFVAIACGGTGGHLFPGIAVAEELKRCGCKIGLLISPKEIDQQAVKGACGMEIFTLPAVGLQNRNYLSFGWSFRKSLKAARTIFKGNPPHAVLAMGGFTSAPPVLAGRKLGAKTFLHESNTIPGRANRFLARFVDEVFVGFSETTEHLKGRKTTVTGTPVRPGFFQMASSAEKCRESLGLDPALPAILVVGGSQGASGLNEMILSALPLLAARNWQWLHLTGAHDFEKVKAVYAAQNAKAVVKPFLAEMDLALRAATVAVSRAGASSLAEMAAVRLPALLVPFPAAADNHQVYNALAFENSGAAKMLQQKHSSPEKVASALGELVENETVRSKMQSALAQWHAPNAAEQIAGNILRASALAGYSKGSGTSPQESSTSATAPRQFSAA